MARQSYLSQSFVGFVAGLLREEEARKQAGK
jgi:hypothetical protein